MSYFQDISVIQWSKCSIGHIMDLLNRNMNGELVGEWLIKELY